MAKMDGNSLCYSALHCLFNLLVRVCFFDVGYCCFAKKQFCEADVILVRCY